MDCIDEIAGVLDSIPSPVMLNMQGVIGFKNNYEDTSESFRDFRTKFRRMYRSKYPEEEEYSNPSFYALRAYDATWIVAKALHNYKERLTPKN